MALQNDDLGTKGANLSREATVIGFVLIMPQVTEMPPPSCPQAVEGSVKTVASLSVSG